MCVSELVSVCMSVRVVCKYVSECVYECASSV